MSVALERKNATLLLTAINPPPTKVYVKIPINPVRHLTGINIFCIVIGVTAPPITDKLLIAVSLFIGGKNDFTLEGTLIAPNPKLPNPLLLLR